MNELVVHRGPDDAGVYVVENEQVALGHRRLAILDLSEAGKQPFFSSCGKLSMVYNGEIYNFIELKQELISKGFTFSTGTDTEVLLAAYQHWGRDCVSKFNGMWAFAIYDIDNGEIFCSRDRFGIKPLYYTTTENQILFGSEIRQLLPFLSERRANMKVLMNYLIAGIENYSEQTFFENVNQLAPGHNMTISVHDRSFHMQRYYAVAPAESVARSDEEQIAQYKKLIIDSVKLRLRSDVQVGGCLSGGLDSSTIAAFAAQEEKSGTKFLAIHAKSSDSFSDESHFAKTVAKASDINLCVIEPTRQDFLGAIDEVIECQEEPFGGPSVFMQYFVMKKARELNCPVLLDGQGGDETLLGYERYYPTMLISLPPSKIFAGFMDVVRNSKLNAVLLAKYFLYFLNASVRRFVLLRQSKFVKRRYRKYLDKGMLAASAKAYRNIDTLQRMEISSIQLPHLLRYEDKNSMWHSIEARLPFLDYRVVEAALATDNRLKFRNGWSKYLLRVITSGLLPEEVVWRRNKLGFEPPVKQWLSSISDEMTQAIEASPLLGKILSSTKIEGLPEVKIWRLYNIAKWEAAFDVAAE